MTNCCEKCKDFDPCYKISCPCHTQQKEVELKNAGAPTHKELTEAVPQAVDDVLARFDEEMKERLDVGAKQFAKDFTGVMQELAIEQARAEGRGVKENITKLKIRAYDEGGADMAREILEVIEGMKGTPRMRGSANQYGYTYALDDLKAAITGLLEK